MTRDISERLADHGIRLKNYVAGEHVTTCPECSHARKKKTDPCLSVKIDGEGGATWICHHCTTTGNVPCFEKPEKWKRPTLPEKPKRPEAMYDWFQGRGISRETVDKAGCYATEEYYGPDKKSCIAFPYRLDGKPVNVKYRTRDKQFKQTQGAMRSLYNIDNVTGDEVIFVEGEMDVLALMAAGIYHAVTLPDGAPKEARFRDDDKRFDALRNCLPKLEGVNKVIIATDSDVPGQALAAELAHRFGKDRCWRVTWDEATKDANAVLQAWGKEALKATVEEAEPWPIDGVYRFEDFGEAVLDMYHGRGPQPVRIGIEGLDDFYKIMPGTFHIVTGVPNHGKSNFLEQITMTLAEKHGWKFGIFSPEHKPAQYASRLLEKHLKKPFYEGPNPRMTPEEITAGLEYVNRHFYYITSNDHTPTIDWILEKARLSCLKYGIKGLVIDPYNEIEAGRDKNQTETEFVSQLISKIKRFCRTHDVTVWVVAHPAKMQRDQNGDQPMPDLYSISGSAHWFNKADMGMVVHRNFEEKTTAVAINKVKEQPAWGSTGKLTFWFDGAHRIYKPTGVF
ncbi:toprim domain-containing protein [Sneathiella sp. CAU 1612]|uniref:Toprim domain-containing protein n=1 Tax=Sneathiella sedimenti TaxID=2816034 RepID=A0ABS3F265_9PROT|nr:bifunctional DNA primase/helicase [Sneathiella sedimenti]MBO0332613.1 toprim domain-containing protein [Sneathiella sedimenti]